MSLNPKALEAARATFARVRNNKSAKTTLMSVAITAAIQAYLDAADLVERQTATTHKQFEALADKWIKGDMGALVKERDEARKEATEREAQLISSIEAGQTLKQQRDEALRLNKELSRAVDQEQAEVELQTGLAETQGRQLAALRDEIKKLGNFGWSWNKLKELAGVHAGNRQHD